MHHQFSPPQFSYLSPLNMQCTAQVKNKVSHVSFALFTLLTFSPCSCSSVFHSHTTFSFFLILCRLWRTSPPSAWPSITPINLPSYSTCPLERKGEELHKERREEEKGGGQYILTQLVHFEWGARRWRRNGTPLHSGNSAVLWTRAVEGYSKSTFHTNSQSFLP